MKKQNGFSLVIILLVIISVIALSCTLTYVFVTKTNDQQTNKTEDSTTKTDISKTQNTSKSTVETETDTAKTNVLSIVSDAYDKYFEAMKSGSASVRASSRAEFEKSITTELANEWESATMVMVDPVLCIQNMPDSSYLKYGDVVILDDDTATIIVTGVFNAGTKYASERPISVSVNTLTNKIASITCE